MTHPKPRPEPEVLRADARKAEKVITFIRAKLNNAILEGQADVTPVLVPLNNIEVAILIELIDWFFRASTLGKDIG